MTDRMSLTIRQAKNVRTARVAAGLSQYELAELTGLTRPKIKRIEKREIMSVSPVDWDKIMSALAGKKSGSSNGAANGRPSRRTTTSTSGRAKVSVEPTPPQLDERMQAEVRRRLEESVLDVMRDLIGESGRVLVEKHKLHEITLGRLFQVS